MGNKNTPQQPEDNLNPEEKEQAVNEFTEVLKDEFPGESLLVQSLERRNLMERENTQILNREREEALRQFKDQVKVDPEVIRRMGIK